MRDLIEKLEEASRPDQLSDFQRESAKLTRDIGLAVNQCIKLKGMWDRFEEIPPKQQKMYKMVGKLMQDLGDVKQDAYNDIEMKLKRYR